MSEDKLFEVSIGANPKKRKEIIEWAISQFGNRVEIHQTLPLLYFKNEQDVSFFMLRWS